jgi:hypothetical protein
MDNSYRLFVPKQAAGTSVVFWDLFNAAGSGSRIKLLSVLPVVSGEVAIVGVTAVDLFLTRTSAVGTGGTAATQNGSSLTAATFTALDNSQPLDGNITARLTPTGGATAGAVVSTRSVFTEETNAGSYVPSVDMVRPWVADLAGIIIPEGTGIRVVQGGVASLGNIAFDVIFNVSRPY